MRLATLMVTLLLALMPAVLRAQAEPPRDSAVLVRRGPVELLLQHAEELSLGDEQVARLEALARRMEEQNRPLVSRLVEIRREVRRGPRVPVRELSPERRAERLRQVELARPLMLQIRENNRAAMEEIRELLTPEQKEQVRELLERRRGGKRGHGRHVIIRDRPF